ncbi:hypothetical protein CTheo_3788 [Ceratobasidium theobromae]|uniref:Uncharacterized protein n=1 Tax=Ceratobasidium theobromae TaxID=1582974 RepID=A0A5N5QMA3_9AGAM|nr:hypothetical protein CTheo_3788 [Ceratobasidium theobromae]
MSPLSKSISGTPGVLLPDEEEDEEPASGHDQADYSLDGGGPGLVVPAIRQTNSRHFSLVSDLTGPPVGGKQAVGTSVLQGAPRGAVIANASTGESSADGAAPILEATLSSGVDSQDRQLLEAYPAASGGGSSPNGPVSYQCGVVSTTVGQTSDVATTLEGGPARLRLPTTSESTPDSVEYSTSKLNDTRNWHV